MSVPDWTDAQTLDVSARVTSSERSPDSVSLAHRATAASSAASGCGAADNVSKSRLLHT
ncbi:MAG: hypothetical protein IPG50_04795 [Myxococcales bacterium]|nr:hypothetical protein [Myxococcales bacterium]